MDKFIEFIRKRPVVIMFVSLLIVIGLAVGITRVTLETGNNTLISDKTDIYKDNESYQEEFGKEPIILIFDEDELFSPETLKLMNSLQSDIKDLNGIYAINSPVTLMNQISSQMLEMTEDGLGQIADNLIMMGDMLSSNGEMEMPDFDMLTGALNQLIGSQNMLGQGLDGIFDAVGMVKMVTTAVGASLNDLEAIVSSDPSRVEELQMINMMKTQLDQATTALTGIESNSQITQIPVATSQALENILTNLQGLSVQMGGIQDNLAELSGGLKTIGQNLKVMQGNFNTFQPGFPTSDETIEMMIYEDGEIRKNFNGFIVGDNKLRMVIVLDSKIKDEEVDVIRDTLLARLDDEEITEGVLISGKPVLDRAVKSSMMNSMVLMMGSAIVIMILILSLFYKVRMRLLPMVMMGLVVIATIGMMGWISVGMTMVSMAVFPILIGLGIDYFIQFQTRYEEERAKL